jgi:hypothetical protein
MRSLVFRCLLPVLLGVISNLVTPGVRSFLVAQDSTSTPAIQSQQPIAEQTLVAPPTNSSRSADAASRANPTDVTKDVDPGQGTFYFLPEKAKNDLYEIFVVLFLVGWAGFVIYTMNWSCHTFRWWWQPVWFLILVPVGCIVSVISAALLVYVCPYFSMIYGFIRLGIGIVRERKAIQERRLRYV